MIPSHLHLLGSPWWKLQVDETLRAQPVHPLIQGHRDRRGALGSCYGRERHRVCSYLSFQRIVCPCQHLETTGGVGEEAGRQTDRQLPSKTPWNSWSRRRLCLAVGQVQAGKAFQTTSVTMPPQPQQNSFCQVRLTE